jgi:spore germination protein YaaH
MNYMKKTILGIFFLSFLVLPATGVFAAGGPAAKPHNLEFAGWMPYWRKTAGTADVTAHIDQLDSVSPFSYNVDKEGNLVDTAKLGQAPWTDLFVVAKEKQVTIIPSILWGNAQDMYTVFSSPSLRKEHTKQIVEKILDDERFSGVDIDYEGKTSETKKHFTLFIKNLAKETRKRKKTLICTIEPRTPIEDKVTTVSKEILLESVQYSNDYKVLEASCDRVRIMAYDQGAIDIKLNTEKKGSNIYAPVADVEWVEKVLKETLKTIPKKKIELGIPTYGYVYEVTPKSETYNEYKRLRAVNYPKALEMATAKGVTLERNSAGELSAVYPADIPAGEAGKGKKIVIWLSDSVAIQQKIDLARKYKLRGVTIFKFDGEHDGKLWEVLK